MLLILGAKRRGRRVGAGVEVTIRETEPALRGAPNHGSRVPVILSGSESEQNAGSIGVQEADFLLERARGGDRIDAVELGLYRRHAEPLYRRRVHARRVKGAELPDVGAPAGVLVLGCLVEDVEQRGVVELRQLLEPAPARERGRNRIVLYPTSIGV